MMLKPIKKEPMQCRICKEVVPYRLLRNHLELHNTQARKLNFNEIREYYREQHRED